MKLNVIASVDETSRQCLSSIAVSGERESTPTARSIVYVSREQCIQYRLRNSVVALTLPSKAGQEAPPPLYALVKMYSKESILFRKEARFPGNLGVREPEAGSPKTWDVVVSNLLSWELSRQHQERGQFGTRKSLETFQEGRSMTSGDSLIEIDAKLRSTQVSNIGSAIQITLDPPTGEGGAQWTPAGAAIAQSLSGSVVSLHGWISYKSPHDSQTFQVLQITSSNSEHPHVALMSDATVVRYATPSVTDRQSSSSRVSDSAAVNKSLVPVSEWIAAVKRVIGGYDDILEQITNHMYGYMETAIDNEGSTSTTSCFQAPFKGILISGRPGTGKSVMASSLAEHSGLPYTIINCPDVFQTGVEAKLFATLLHLVDSINLSATGSKIFIIALTNRLHAVDSSLTRSGRLDKVFDLHLKGVEQRLQVLKIVSKDPKEKSETLRKVARATHGYVPTDLQALCTESAVVLISQMASGQGSCANIDFSYFEHALKTIRPSGMGEFQSKIPTVKFSDLYGIQDAIADLRVSIIEPFHHPEKYLDLGIAPPRGVIIHGPPGVGKTMLCCALAEELGINFMLVESSQIRSKVVGESEQNIARMFAQAKANAPCILFIDQIDILAPSRGSTHTSENSGDRIVTGLLTATNRPEVIDAAILRPGRLDQIVHIPVPDLKARQEILEGYISKMPMRISPEEIADMARTTDGYSGADLENLCREAALICLRQDINNTEIVRSHLEAARLVSKPSLLGYEDSHLFSR
ncbi:spermatogenesis associated protein 5 [Mortierella antarctica]|nr:spermatogenesis associated protein 5 [Mortierella antarctica]